MVVCPPWGKKEEGRRRDVTYVSKDVIVGPTWGKKGKGRKRTCYVLRVTCFSNSTPLQPTAHSPQYTAHTVHSAHRTPRTAHCTYLDARPEVVDTGLPVPSSISCNEGEREGGEGGGFTRFERGLKW